MTIVEELRLLLDESKGSVYWPTAELHDALNEAVLTVYSESRTILEVASLSVNAGDDVVYIPPTIMIPQHIESMGTKYFITTHAQLESYARDWKTAEFGEPKRFVYWDATRLRVWPRPDQSYDFDLYGVPYPDEINDKNPDLKDDRLICEAVLHMAAAELVEHLYPQQADEYTNTAAEALRKMRVRLRNQNSHNIRRLRPGKSIDKQQQGFIGIGQTKVLW